MLTDVQAERIVSLLTSIDSRLARLEANGGSARGARRRPSLKAKDRAALEALVPVIAANKQPRVVFYARDVLQYIESMPEVVSAVLDGKAIDCNSTKCIGKLLARADASGCDVAGHVVQRGSEDSDGVFWSIHRV